MPERRLEPASLSRFSGQRPHIAYERRYLPPSGNRLGAVSALLPRASVTLRHARVLSAMHPAAAVRHRRRPARAPASCPRPASRAEVHWQFALHPIDPSVSRDPHPPGSRRRPPPPAPRDGRGVLELIRTLRDRGAPVILITHILPDAFAVTDRVIVMHRGRKVAEKMTAETNAEELVQYMVGAREMRRRRERVALSRKRPQAEEGAPPA